MVVAMGDAAANQPHPCEACYIRPAAKNSGGWCRTCFDGKSRNLSDIQIGLMVRASMQTLSLELRRDEVPAAAGLERRGFVSTQRPERGLSFGRRRRYVKGSRRYLSLRRPGVAYVKKLGDRAERYRNEPTREPMSGDAALVALRELAEFVVDDRCSEDGSPSRRLVNRARAVLDELRDGSDSGID